MLQVRVSRQFRQETGAPFTLQISFNAKPGITVLYGTSGSGKSLTLQLVAGIYTPDEGRISVGEEVFFDSYQSINIPIRKRKVGYLFQDLAIFPHLTVMENVTYGLYEQKLHQRVRQARLMLEQMKIDSLSGRLPRTLSGGERQRVALARALIIRPRLLLLDEPLSALDLPVKRGILVDLARINRELQIPMLYVTHDRTEALTLGESLLIIEHGKVVAEGTPLEVIERPEIETVANLFGVENVFDAQIVSGHPEKGTMTCQVGACLIEIPYREWPREDGLRVGIRSGDILVASEKPIGLSAQNVLPATVERLEFAGFEVHIWANCGQMFKVTLTRNAFESLGLKENKQIWLVFKSHSCHILR